MSDTLLLIDLSSIVHALWHQSSDQPDPGWTSKQAIARAHALASAHQHAAICCDSRRSFRKEADPTYKANRPAQEAPLTHQMLATIDALKADGFPCWIADGYEADDIIATAVKCALACSDDDRIVIATADKDLTQLIGPRVTMHKTSDGNTLDAAGVVEKFGVRPDQMLDYLCLVGDSSDNVRGAEGIGPKKAAALLATFGTLDALYAAIDAQTAKLANGQSASLAEFRERWPKVRELLRLRDDAPVPFEEIAAERAPREADAVSSNGKTAEFEAADAGSIPAAAATPAPTQALVTHAPQSDFSLQLEPRDFDEAMKLASKLWLAKGVNKFGCAEAVFMVIIAGRELGLPALASVRAFHWIESEPRPSADLLAGLVLKSGKARYFRSIARTREHAIFETQRGDDPPVQLECTITEERAAFRKDQKAWDASGWGKTPADMLSARAKSKLARLVYPDVVGGLYSPEEFD